MTIGTFVVDDQADIRLLVRMVVQGAGGGLFVKGEAGNGRDALAALDAVDPDVVLIDEMMPGLTGLE
ncbi:MAG: response regulator transcription factor, partial [Actinomycetota bacterium]